MSHVMDCGNQVLNVAYSNDGNYIVMSDKSENLRLVDVRNGKNKVSIFREPFLLIFAEPFLICRELAVR